MTEDEMVGWHHQLNRHGFGWTLGVGEGQGSLEYCNSWGYKESDTTERLNRTKLNLLDIGKVFFQFNTENKGNKVKTNR